MSLLLPQARFNKALPWLSACLGPLPLFPSPLQLVPALGAAKLSSRCCCNTLRWLLPQSFPAQIGETELCPSCVTRWYYTKQIKPPSWEVKHSTLTSSLGLSCKGSAAPRLTSAAGPGQPCAQFAMTSKISLPSLGLSPCFLQETFVTTGITRSMMALK